MGMMQAFRPASGGETDADLKVSFRTRLRAWWEGCDVSDLLEAETSAAAAVESEQETGGEANLEPSDDFPETPMPGEVPHWTPQRITTVQKIFGEGRHLPGIASEIRALTDRLELSDQMKVLELGAGLAPLGRLIGSQTGARVTCVEPDPCLAEAAGELVTNERLDAWVKIVNDSIMEMEIPPQSLDAVIARESLYTIQNKPPLLGRMVEFLKPGGQFLYVDFMLKTPEPKHPAVEAWRSMQPEQPHLIEAIEMRNIMGYFGFKVRTADEVSDQYAKRVVATLKEFSKSLRTTPLQPRQKKWLLWEVDLWSKRVAAIESGEVGVFLAHAELPEEGAGGE